MIRTEIEDLEVRAGNGPGEKGPERLLFVSLSAEWDKKGPESAEELCGRTRRMLAESPFSGPEEAAERLCAGLLEEVPCLRRLNVSVSVPREEGGIPARRITCRVSRGWEEAFIGLRSGAAGRMDLLNEGAALLYGMRGLRGAAVSSYYETVTGGYAEPEAELTAGVRAQTYLTPEELAERLKETEEAAGTRAGEPGGLKADLWLCGGRVLHTEKLTLPHPDLKERDGALWAMLELAPWAADPVTGKTMRELGEEKGFGTE